MKNDNVKVNSAHKDKGISFKELMSKILKSKAIVNGILQNNNINLKVVDSCPKREKR